MKVSDSSFSMISHPRVWLSFPVPFGEKFPLASGKFPLTSIPCNTFSIIKGYTVTKVLEGERGCGEGVGFVLVVKAGVIGTRKGQGGLI